jgi:hypothetical protein
MTWMTYTGLILWSNGTYKISDFAMADSGLMKFVMTLMGLHILLYWYQVWVLISTIINSLVVKNFISFFYQARHSHMAALADRCFVSPRPCDTARPWSHSISGAAGLSSSRQLNHCALLHYARAVSSQAGHTAIWWSRWASQSTHPYKAGSWGSGGRAQQRDDVRVYMVCAPQGCRLGRCFPEVVFNCMCICLSISMCFLN